MKERASVALTLMKPSSGFSGWSGSGSFVFCNATPALAQAHRVGTCRGEQISSISASVRGEHYYWEVEKDSIGFDKSRLIVASSRLPEQIDAIENFLSQIEIEMGLEPTEIFEISNLKKNGAYLFVGDPMWLCPPMRSLLCLCIRNVGFVAQPGIRTYRECVEEMGYQNREFFSSQENRKFFLSILRYSPKALFGEDPKAHYPKGPSARSFHDYGIEYTARNNDGYLADKLAALVKRAHKRLAKLEEPSAKLKEAMAGRVKRSRPIGIINE